MLDQKWGKQGNYTKPCFTDYDCWAQRSGEKLLSDDNPGLWYSPLSPQGLAEEWMKVGDANNDGKISREEFNKILGPRIQFVKVLEALVTKAVAEAPAGEYKWSYAEYKSPK